jgi:hypothetical protein
MKIAEVRYDPGTLSAPAFLDFRLVKEDGTTDSWVALRGKAAKKAYTAYKVGDEYNG